MQSKFNASVLFYYFAEKHPVFYRCPVLALILMVLQPGDYEPDSLDSNVRAHPASLDLNRLETLADKTAAREVTEEIMRHYNLTEESIREELDVGGVNWSKAGSDRIDLSFVVAKKKK